MTGSFSKRGQEMFTIAVYLANFDRVELMLEIYRLQRNKSAKINEPTVLQAMDNIYHKYHDQHTQEGAL